MKLKFRTRYHCLKNGAHVILVINTKMNKASITTAMIAATCNLLNIKFICATVGHKSELLSRSLGPRNVTQIKCPSWQGPRPVSGSLSISDNPIKMSGHHKLQALVHDAREKSAILLLDANIEDGFDASTLVQAMCLMRRETISIVWPVCNDKDVEDGSRVINCVKPEQCMVHLHDFGFAGINKCGENAILLRRLPIWQSEGLTNKMIQAMERSKDYSYLPPLPELPKYYDDFIDYIQPDHKPAICSLLGHLYLAAEATTEHIFNPISEEML